MSRWHIFLRRRVRENLLAKVTERESVTAWPSVTTIVPTRDRPELLKAAVQSILAQDYSGELQVLVVVDQTDPARLPAEIRDSDRVRIMPNTRSPGLAGARNTGIEASATDLVAFCDDDDSWRPDKLTRQVAALLDREGTFATCAIEVSFEDRRTLRRAGSDTITHADLLRSRMAMIHSSTFVIDRAALIERFGLISEDLPRSQNEDWDLLLRASRQVDLVHVDEPLVVVTWWPQSYFATDWLTKNESLEWMLDHHPDLRSDRPGAARVYGQLAFGYAAAGRRREALRWIGRTMRTHWREPRAYIAVAATAGASPNTMLRFLHRRGHGI